MTEALLQADLTILEDVTGSGRKVDWRARKVANEYLATAYDDFDPRKAARLRSCATMLVYGVDAEGRRRLRGANFCRCRLCPICQWRRSLKLYGQMRRVMDYLRPEGYAYIFLTLTATNIDIAGLSDMIDCMGQAFNRLTKYDDFRRAVKGWYRGLEITHNLHRLSPSFDTYHPHYHVILAVRPSYFKSRDYISQARWVDMWQRALDVTYRPIVDIRRVNGDTAKAVAEATKYTAKTKDYIILEDWDLTVQTVRDLDEVLHHRRLIGFGGCLRDARQQLEQEDPENGDLIGVDPDGVDVKDVYFESYGWHTGFSQYFREE